MLTQKAINPSYSSWISASAGTGKTKLLTDRIINLLLDGVSPNSILCLTFTKAARSEMLSRINRTLYSFSTMEIEHLRERLRILLGQNISEKQIIFAKNLYHNYSQTRSKIKIYTIHGFCQNIIQRFPIECGLKPNCKVIDEIESKKILKSILGKDYIAKEIPNIIRDSVSSFYIVELIKEYLEFFYSKYESDKKIEFLQIKEKLLHYFSHHIITDPNQNEASLKKYIKNELGDNITSIGPIFQALVNYYSDDKTSVLQEVFILEYFLTKTFLPRKKLIKKEFLSADPNIEEKFLYIQDEIFCLKKSYDIIQAIEKNSALVKLASKISDEYRKYKNDNSFLDYNDLIEVTFKLLCKKDIKEWIRYKLDETIDHILVDESQDTSETQWSIIKALADDFFTGDGYKEEKKRTIFVVGDLKQSIYSFQGARPDLFEETKNFIKNKAIESGANFIECNLDTTYRLPKVIFSFIHSVFSKIQMIEEVRKLECFHKESYSTIEIWPLVQEIKEDKKLFWPNPSELTDRQNSKLLSAKKIAKYIKDTLDSGLFIESKKRIVRESDFLILVQKRSLLNKYLFKEIEAMGINISGLDRLSINKSLAINDITSLFKFILHPNDNLNLASLLKSPFFGLNESDIYKFRSMPSIADSIEKIFPEVASELEIIKQIYKHKNLKDFIFEIIYRYGIIEYFSKIKLEEEVDSIKIFMKTIHNIYERDPTISIVDVIDLFNSQDFEIKRDFSSSDGVRIMTVHGSKGLESPFVIIADAHDVNISPQNPFLNLYYMNTEIPIWSSQYPLDLFANQKKEIKKSFYDEYLRLLYVALTRAQDHLIIVGQGDEKVESDYYSWYQLCKNSAMEYFDEEENILKISDGVKKNSLKLISLEENNLKSNYKPEFFGKTELNLPELTHYAFEAEHTKIGKIIHRILEYMPDQSELEYKNYIDSIKLEYTEDICQIIDKVERNSFFKFLRSLPNKKEFELAAMIDKKFKVLRIDFVAFDDQNNSIVIVDFKTDRVKSDFNEEYNKQLGEYKIALSKIYPTKEIKAYLYFVRFDSFVEVTAKSL